MIPSSIYSNKFEQGVENQFVVTNEERQRRSKVLTGSLPYPVLHTSKRLHKVFGKQEVKGLDWKTKRLVNHVATWNSLLICSTLFITIHRFLTKTCQVVFSVYHITIYLKLLLRIKIICFTNLPIFLVKNVAKYQNKS